LRTDATGWQAPSPNGELNGHSGHIRTGLAHHQFLNSNRHVPHEIPFDVGFPPSAGSLTVAQEATSETASSGVKRALIICGLPGDKEHALLYSTAVRELRSGLTTRLGFAEANVHLQFGGVWPEEAAKPETAAPQHGPATREALEQEAADLRKDLRPEDALWVIVLGHSHYDGRKATLNLPGPDFTSLEFGKLFSGLQCREQVFFITTSVSGFYLKPLAASGRVVISATEPDFETNETIFARSLAEELGKLTAADYPDEDKDGVRSLFDLYIGVTRNVAQKYVDDKTLATEHAQLEDNGDGRGTELQIDYLTVEQGGRFEGKALPPRPATADGTRSKQWVLLPGAPTAMPDGPAKPTDEKAARADTATAAESM
jgi:hypothetical protein